MNALLTVRKGRRTVKMVAPKLMLAAIGKQGRNSTRAVLVAKALVGSSFHTESSSVAASSTIRGCDTHHRNKSSAAASNAIRLHHPTKPSSLIRFKSTLFPPSDIHEKSSTSNKPADETTTAAAWSDTINLGIQLDKQELEASSVDLKESIQEVVSSSQEDEKENADAVVATTSSSKKPWMWDLGIPSLTQEWKNMFSASTFFTEVSAGKSLKRVVSS